MKAKIEDYRGLDIYFDTYKEIFYAQSDEYDKQEEKKSFASAKKYVDDFIKDNTEFKPVWIVGNHESYNRGRIKLIGIRKDGRFVYEGHDGQKEQMSTWTEKDYMLENPANEPIFKKIEEAEACIVLVREEITELKNRLVVVGLNTIKKKYLK